MTAPLSSAERVTWNLADLYASISDPQIDADIKKSQDEAKAFVAELRKKDPNLVKDVEDVLQADKRAP